MPVNSFTEAEDVLLGIVDAAWTAHAPMGAPLRYENLDTTRPQVPSVWGRVVVRNVPGEYAGLGPNRLRRFGTLFVQLFVPQNSGTKVIGDLANALVVAIQTASIATLNGIRLRDIGATELGSDGTYFQVNVQAGFEYDTTAA